MIVCCPRMGLPFPFFSTPFPLVWLMLRVVCPLFSQYHNTACVRFKAQFVYRLLLGEKRVKKGSTHREAPNIFKSPFFMTNTSTTTIGASITAVVSSLSAQVSIRVVILGPRFEIAPDRCSDNVLLFCSLFLPFLQNVPQMGHRSKDVGYGSGLLGRRIRVIIWAVVRVGSKPSKVLLLSFAP